jgi:hypothetical protein
VRWGVVWPLEAEVLVVETKNSMPVGFGSKFMFPMKDSGTLPNLGYTFIILSIVFSHLFLFSVTDFFNLSKWESVPKRSESPESTEPDTVLLSVSLCERSRSLSIRLTSVSSAERTLSRELALESGTADLAARPLLEAPTLFPLLLPSLSAVPLDV